MLNVYCLGRACSALAKTRMHACTYARYSIAFQLRRRRLQYISQETKLAHLQLKTLLHLEQVCEGRSLQACPPEDQRCSCWSAQKRLVCIAACCMLESDLQQALTLKIILAETALAVNKDNTANNVSVRSGVSRTILGATVIRWPGAK